MYIVRLLEKVEDPSIASHARISLSPLLFVVVVSTAKLFNTLTLKKKEGYMISPIHAHGR